MPFLFCLGTNWLKALIFLSNGKSNIAEPSVNVLLSLSYINVAVTLWLLSS